MTICSSRVRSALHNFESGLCLSEERNERGGSDESPQKNRRRKRKNE